MLLRKRGAPVPAMVIAVPKSVIRERISELEKKESLYIEKIKTVIIAMQKDIDKILGNPGCPEVAKQNLLEVRSDLEQNLAHIKAGRKIEDLPIIFEELGVVSAHQSAFSSDIFSDSDAPKRAASVDAASAHEKKGRGFIFQLWTWLTTPTTVSWRAAKTWLRNKKQ